MDYYYRLTRQNLGSIPVKPRATGIAVGLAYYILLFSQSTSDAVLDKMDKPVRLREIALGTTKRRLASGDLRLENLKDAKARSIAVYKAMEPELAFLPLDCSRSRWNAEDVKDLQEPVVRQLLNSVPTWDYLPFCL